MKLLLLGPALVVVAITYSCLFLERPQRGGAFEKWQTENKTFKVRVTAYEEKGAMVNGGYYVFESAAQGSSDWREIVTFRHDDQPNIHKDQVHFVNDQVGYLFMGWTFAVTTNSGAGWSVWDAEKDLPNWQCCNYGLIRDVQLSVDGVGTMTLNPIPQRRGEVPELHTRDYGRHWAAE
jgi:hypothetical protein